MQDWSATHYLQFEAERTRPASDLLARVPDGAIARIADLGCGPGNSTELLANRFPRAAILGLDSSDDMLAKARGRLPHVAFEKADVARWRASAPLDLIFANAVLQWIPDHIALMVRLIVRASAGRPAGGAGAGQSRRAFARADAHGRRASALRRQAGRRDGGARADRRIHRLLCGVGACLRADRLVAHDLCPCVAGSRRGRRMGRKHGPATVSVAARAG